MRNRLLLLTATALVLMACGGAATEGTVDPPSQSSWTAAADELQPPVDEPSSHPDEAGAGHADETEATHGHSDDVATSGQEVDSTVEVAMSEFSFEPSSIEVVAGETVEFVVANEGVIEHEFRLTSHHEVEDHMSGGHADHGEDADHDMMVLVAPGETGTLTVTFSSGGEIELYACLLPGHYEAGMEGDLEFQE